MARFFTALVLCLSAGYADLYLFIASIPVWYGSLQKPVFIPSVTIIYYGIIAVSLLLSFCLYSIWNSALKNREARIAVWLFLTGLVLNVAWFAAFFWARSAFFSMFVMIILLTVAIATMYQSLRSAVLAVLFQIPYLLILLGIAYVNVMIYLMNPALPLLGVTF
jgi:tryptophan-rich sensory protein